MTKSVLQFNSYVRSCFPKQFLTARYMHLKSYIRLKITNEGIVFLLMIIDTHTYIPHYVHDGTLHLFFSFRFVSFSPVATTYVRTYTLCTRMRIPTTKLHNSFSSFLFRDPRSVSKKSIFVDFPPSFRHLLPRR